MQGIIITYDLFITNAIEKRTEKHKEALAIINDFWGHADICESELEKLLDKDDPILTRFGVIQVIIGNLTLAIEHELDSDEPIDPDGM